MENQNRMKPRSIYDFSNIGSFMTSGKQIVVYYIISCIVYNQYLQSFDPLKPMPHVRYNRRNKQSFA